MMGSSNTQFQGAVGQKKSGRMPIFFPRLRRKKKILDNLIQKKNPAPKKNFTPEKKIEKCPQVAAAGGGAYLRTFYMGDPTWGM